eukprot:c10068_g1_i2.p1 GENE.c10068_g1_i2~~c10068_g1_i2.p1  ORF type:complete len:683 (+),score=135.59 c10068_g1_i2:26-2050(+)
MCTKFQCSVYKRQPWEEFVEKHEKDSLLNAVIRSKMTYSVAHAMDVVCEAVDRVMDLGLISEKIFSIEELTSVYVVTALLFDHSQISFTPEEVSLPILLKTLDKLRCYKYEEYLCDSFAPKVTDLKRLCKCVAEFEDEVLFYCYDELDQTTGLPVGQTFTWKNTSRCFALGSSSDGPDTDSECEYPVTLLAIPKRCLATAPNLGKPFRFGFVLPGTEFRITSRCSKCHEKFTIVRLECVSPISDEQHTQVQRPTQTQQNYNTVLVESHSFQISRAESLARIEEGKVELLGSRGRPMNETKALECFESALCDDYPPSFVFPTLILSYATNYALKDYDRALMFLKKAIDFGLFEFAEANGNDANALFAAGLVLSWGLIEKDFSCRFAYLDRGAKLGDLLCKCFVAWCHGTGNGTLQDRIKAFTLVEPLMNECVFGKSVYLMISIEQYDLVDVERFLEVCNSAAQDGESVTGYLARMYLHKLQKTNIGLNMLCEAFQQENYTWSLSSLALYFEQVNEPHRALIWLLKSLEYEIIDSAYHIGRFYLHGIGFHKSDQSARKWFQRATHYHPASCLTELGYALSSTNPDSAFKCFQKATSLESQDGWCGMGYAYRYGIGTARDNDRAIQCFKRVADCGNKLSQIHLAEMVSRNEMESLRRFELSRVGIEPLQLQKWNLID